MQQKTWSDFDSLSSYIYFLPTQEGPRALTTAQDGESFNGKYNNFLEKNLEKSKEINIQFFRCFHQFFPRNFLSLSSWKQDALYYFI